MIPYLAFSAIAAIALVFFAIEASRTSNWYLLAAVAMFTLALGGRLVRGIGDQSLAGWAVDVGALLYGYAFVLRARFRLKHSQNGANHLPANNG